jgi:hypothetical protein
LATSWGTLSLVRMAVTRRNQMLPFSYSFLDLRPIDFGLIVLVQAEQAHTQSCMHKQTKGKFYNKNNEINCIPFFVPRSPDSAWPESSYYKHGWLGESCCLLHQRMPANKQDK